MFSAGRIEVIIQDGKGGWGEWNEMRDRLLNEGGWRGYC